MISYHSPDQRRRFLLQLDRGSELEVEGVLSVARRRKRGDAGDPPRGRQALGIAGVL